MKLIHLNVESFKYFDALVDFLEVEKPDILSLVEVTDGVFFGSEGGQKRDYIGELCDKFGWNSVFHPTVFRDFGTHKISFGAAVLSSYPVSQIDTLYIGNDEPCIRPSDHISFSDKPKYELYPYAWKLNLPFLVTHVQTEKGPVKLLTVHFHVSYDCLETLQIWQDAERVVEYLNSIGGMPTILTGDMNIRNESMAIKILREKMTQHSENFGNTLCLSVHPLFVKEPNNPGYGIDHIFTKDIAVDSCQLREVEVSDHLPVVLDFSL